MDTTYVAPALRVLGTVHDLTLTRVISGSS
jgi:hypothetical protein